MKCIPVDIVLIEDNPYDAELTLRSLKSNNVSNNVLHLKDGEDALHYIHSLKNAKELVPSIFPKVILLDLKLPKISGIELLRCLKMDKLLNQIPVVVLTSSNEGPDIRACSEIGANSYIVKPVEFDDFHKVVLDLGLYWVLLNKTA